MTTQTIDQEIQSVTQKIVEKYRPEKIILFGSAAWGKFTPGFDLDFLIVKKGVDHLRRNERYYQVSRLLSHNVAMDILVYTPYEIKKRLYLEDPFIRKVINEGKVIYGS